MSRCQPDEQLVLQWLQQRKMYATLVAMEEEIGSSILGLNGKLTVVREFCFGGKFDELRSLIQRILPDNSSLISAIVTQQLKERLIKLDSKHDVLRFVTDLNQLKVHIPDDLCVSLESVLTCADPGKHSVFSDWSQSKGRYLLFQHLCDALRPVFPECFDPPAVSDSDPNPLAVLIDKYLYEQTVSAHIRSNEPLPAPTRMKSDSSARPPYTTKLDPSSLVLMSEFRESDSQPIRAVSFSPDGQYLAIGTNSQSLVLCSASTGSLRTVGKSVRAHSGSVYTCAWSRDSRWIATGSNDQTIRISPVSQLMGESVERSGSRLQPQLGTVRSLCYLDNSSLVAGFSSDGVVRIFDDGKLKSSLPCCDEGYVNNVDSDGSQLFIASSSRGAVTVLDPRAGRAKVWELPVFLSTSSAIASLYDNKVVVGCETGTVSLWDIRSHLNTVWKHDGVHSASIRAVDFNGDGTYIASCSFDKSVKIIDSATGDLKTSLAGHTDRVVGLSWRNGWKHSLATCGSDGRAMLWAPALNPSSSG